MPDPIMSTPSPLVCFAEEPEVIEIEPVVITGSKALSPLKRDLNTPFTPSEVGTMAMTCLGELNAVAILAIGAAPVALPVAVLGALKTGLDYSKCIALAQTDILVQRRTEACRDEGGTPLITADRQVRCEIEVEVEP